MGFLIKVIVTGLAVFVADFLMESVNINDDWKTVIIVALVLALLNTFIKPILVLLTIPVTVLTLGLFLLVINALMVLWAARIVDGFEVEGWWSALIFSLIVSVVTFILNGLAKERKEN